MKDQRFLVREIDQGSCGGSIETLRIVCQVEWYKSHIELGFSKCEVVEIPHHNEVSNLESVSIEQEAFLGPTFLNDCSQIWKPF